MACEAEFAYFQKSHHLSLQPDDAFEYEDFNDEPKLCGDTTGYGVTK